MAKGNDTGQSSSTDTITIAQQFQDRLIASRLPDWMGKVGATDYSLLGEALADGLQSRHQLAKLWGRIEGLESFCTTRLNTALAPRFGINLDGKKHFLRQWYVYTSTESSYYTSRLPTPATDYFDVSLLSAAMTNFSKEQAAEGGQHARNALVDVAGSTVTAAPALAFAKLCRELDLGGQYKRHLDAVLGPHGQPQTEPDCKALLQKSYRANLMVDALKAHAEGVLKDAELTLMAGLYTHGKLGRLQGAPVVAKQLEAFKCPLQQIVVFDVIDEGLLRNTSKRVLVYIPGDPEGAWCVANDLEAFARRILGKRLRKEDYRRFFERFVLQRDRPAFFARVEQRLGDVVDAATRELDQHMKDYPAPLFEHLATMRIEQIKEDAQVFVTPVALIDRDNALAKSARRHAQGMALFTLAGLFIPAVGAALLTVMAWELLSEVFQSVKDWREGDTSAALDHLVSVGKDVALLAATTAGAVAARTLWERSVMVDNLIPAVLEDGSEKLWNQDLTPYASVPPPLQANLTEDGVYRLDEQSWIEMDGNHYPVYQEENGDWYLQPYENHAPLLEHNGAGAWRLWSERPAEWRGSEHMFRRLGSVYGRLADRQIGEVLAVLGLTEDHLRAVHVFSSVPEAELADTVNRFVLAQRIDELTQKLETGAAVSDQVLLDEVRSLPGADGLEGQALAELVREQRRVLFQSLYDQSNPASDGGVQLLRRDFTSLHRLAAEQIWNEASDVDRQLLLDTQRVPLTMALTAQQRALRIRVARVFEGLFIDTPQTLDLARGVIKLIDTLPGAPKGRHWVLFDNDGLHPPHLAGEGESAFRLGHQEGLFVLHNGPGEVPEQPGELFEVLADTFTDEQRVAMGIGEPFAEKLRGALAGLVGAQRQDMAKLLAREQPTPSFLRPLRLDDGRIGYSLSGGRRVFGYNTPRSLITKLRYLYPSYSDLEIQEWLASVERQEADVQATLDSLESEFELLRSTLTTWQREGVVHFEHRARYRMRKELIKSWRRLIPELPKAANKKKYFKFTLRDMGVSRLPDLPESISFPHITALDLRKMKFTELPDNYLRAYPNLTSVEITHSKLKQLPSLTGLRERLRILDLSDNRIRLDAEQPDVFDGYKSLRYLNLSRNPLKNAFSVTGMPKLTTLILRNTKMAQMPLGVGAHKKLIELEMLGNELAALPDGFIESRLWDRGRVRFDSERLGQAVVEGRAWYRPADGGVPPRVLWIDRVDAEDREDMNRLWLILADYPESTDFVDLLGGLVLSEDFAHDNTAYALAYRIYNMMILMEDEESVREQMFASADIRTCGDNAILRFTDMEIWVMAWEAEQGEYHIDPEPGLMRLGAQLWRQSALDDYARRFVEDMPEGTDEVEVVLAFRVRLFDDLDLPGERSRLRFSGAVGDIDMGVDEARTTILADQTEDLLGLWMTEQRFWTKYLERAYGSKLKLPRRFRDEEQAMSRRQASDEELSALQDRVNQWKLDQRLALTLAAMRRVTPGWRLPVLAPVSGQR